MAKELARLDVSSFRRTLGVSVQVVLAVFLLFTVATNPTTSIFWSLALAAFGFGLLWFAWRFWHATQHSLILTGDGLFDSDGKHFCSFDEITKVDRGLFAFRPSSGFLIRLNRPVPRGWAPGLWWSFGKSIGVGGATSRPAGKQMADILSVMLTDRGAEILKMNEDKSDD